nr:hypothetical protein [Tanacetum cinerariifolium]
TIAYSLIWGLEIDIRGTIFSDLIRKLQNKKKNTEANICYTRYLFLIFEEPLKENYINDNITFVKPYTISAASFQTLLASEVSLTSHMLKVAKLFQKHEQSLILFSKKVNVDDGADKSLSGTTVQPITQPKAPTDLKLRKQKILPSSKPKFSYQGSQRSTSDDFDVIDITPKNDEQGDTYNSGLMSMPDDDLTFLTGFKTSDSTDNGSQKGTVETLYAFADKPAQSDPIGHLHEDLCTLTTKVNQLESNITKQVTDVIQSSIPSLVVD